MDEIADPSSCFPPACLSASAAAPTCLEVTVRVGHLGCVSGGQVVYRWCVSTMRSSSGLQVRLLGPSRAPEKHQKRGADPGRNTRLSGSGWLWDGLRLKWSAVGARSRSAGGTKGCCVQRNRDGGELLASLVQGGCLPRFLMTWLRFTVRMPPCHINSAASMLLFAHFSRWPFMELTAIRLFDGLVWFMREEG